MCGVSFVSVSVAESHDAGAAGVAGVPGAAVAAGAAANLRSGYGFSTIGFMKMSFSGFKQVSCGVGAFGLTLNLKKP